MAVTTLSNRCEKCFNTALMHPQRFGVFLTLKQGRPYNTRSLSVDKNPVNPPPSWRISSILGAIALAVLTCLVLLWSQPTVGQSNRPRQRVEWAYPTNYGERVSQDIHGNLLRNPLIVVIHETVGSAASAVNYFKTPNYSHEGEQVSYHALIDLDGTIIFTVPFQYRAFGAGNSVFMGDNGPESVQTNAKIPASVNNFAYHFSLETPEDGRNNADRHSGYTVKQYQSLAWLVRYTKVPEARVTYHKTIDRSGTRKDPRSFNRDLFLQSLHLQQAADRTSVNGLALMEQLPWSGQPPA